VQLRESGTPVEQIQLGRAEGDDETWGDLLEMETDDPWMRNPQVNELLEGLGMLDDPPAPAAPAKQQQQQQQGKQREQPPDPPAS
jgi:hypothetical protein